MHLMNSINTQIWNFNNVHLQISNQQHIEFGFATAPNQHACTLKKGATHRCAPHRCTMVAAPLIVELGIPQLYTGMPVTKFYQIMQPTKKCTYLTLAVVFAARLWPHPPWLLSSLLQSLPGMTFFQLKISDCNL